MQIKYQNHWELAMSEHEEWRLARSEYRTLPGVKKGNLDASSENGDPEHSNSRRRNRHDSPEKKQIAQYTLYFVRQAALIFGSNAKPPRKRRPVLVVRVDYENKRALAAPLTTKRGDSQRTLLIEKDSKCMKWKVIEEKRVVSFLYDSPEFVRFSDFRMQDSDSPLADMLSPLLDQCLSFVYEPPNMDI